VPQNAHWQAILGLLTDVAFRFLAALRQ